MAWNVGGVSSIVESMTAADQIRAASKQTDFSSYLKQALLGNYPGMPTGMPYGLSGYGMQALYGGNDLYGLYGNSLFYGADNILLQKKLEELAAQQTSLTDRKKASESAETYTAESSEAADRIRLRVLRRYQQKPAEPTGMGTLDKYL